MRFNRRRLLPGHPIYVERDFKEHALLEDLVRREPPSVGLDAFIHDLEASATGAPAPTSIPDLTVILQCPTCSAAWGKATHVLLGGGCEQQLLPAT